MVSNHPRYAAFTHNSPTTTNRSSIIITFTVNLIGSFLFKDSVQLLLSVLFYFTFIQGSTFVKMKRMKVLLFLAILFSGLVAGLVYAYSCSVNTGLKNLDDAEFLTAMQSINIAIQNPLFFTSFMGLLVIFPVTALKYYHAGANTTFCLILASAAIYIVAVFGVTILGNVPLNETLAKFNLNEASPGEVASIRRLFEKPWNTFHTIRTIASIISFSVSILPAILQKI